MRPEVDAPRSRSTQPKPVHSVTATNLMLVTDDLIFTCDLDGQVLEVNRAFETVLGWEKTDLIGHSLTELVHRDDRLSVEKALSEARESGKTRMRLRLPKKNDEEQWYEIEGVRDGEYIYTIGRRRERGPTADLESVVATIMRREQSGFNRKAQEHADELTTQTRKANTAEKRADLSEKRANTMSVWAGALVMVLGTVGGAVKWAYDKVEENAVRALELQHREAEVDKRFQTTDTKLDQSFREAHQEITEAKTEFHNAVEELKAADGDLDDKVHRVAGGLVATQVQVSDSTTYLSKQLAEIDPDVRRVRKPDTVRLAEDKAKAVRKKAAEDKLLGVTDPANPLLFLEESSLDPLENETSDEPTPQP